MQPYLLITRLAHEVNNAEEISFPRGKCLLCNRGKKDGKIKKTSLMELKNKKKTIKLKIKNLNCKNFRRYEAKFCKCEEFYVGQIIKSF